ncbi:MAG TPA: DoxX family protein [Micromonosporaceae bacterium]
MLSRPVGMNTFLWILQILLAALFTWSGLAKGLMSRQRLLASGQTGIAVYPMPVVRATAVCELLAAAGLLLPWATGLAPALTPLAAVGLCVVMVGAAIAHTKLREPRNVAANAVIFAAAITVALARFAELS